MRPRPISVVSLSSRFQKAFKQLPVRIQLLVERRVVWFQKNAHDARLNTHALRGNLAAYHAFSVNREYRILFRFVEASQALFISIGTHEVYR